MRRPWERERRVLCIEVESLRAEVRLLDARMCQLEGAPASAPARGAFYYHRPEVAATIRGEVEEGIENLYAEADARVPDGKAVLVSGDSVVVIENIEEAMRDAYGFGEVAALLNRYELSAMEWKLASSIASTTRVVPLIEDDGVSYAFVDRHGVWQTRTVDGTNRRRLDVLRNAARSARLDHNESQRRTSYGERKDPTPG